MSLSRTDVPVSNTKSHGEVCRTPQQPSQSSSFFLQETVLLTWLTWFIVNCFPAKKISTYPSEPWIQQHANSQYMPNCLDYGIRRVLETPRPWQFCSISWQGIWPFDLQLVVYVWAKSVNQPSWIILTLCSCGQRSILNCCCITYSPNVGIRHSVLHDDIKMIIRDQTGG